MADQHVAVRGWLVAEVEPDDWPSGSQHHGGRLFLFRTPSDWTLLSVSHVARWGDLGPADGWCSVSASTHADLEAVRADLVRAGRRAEWRALVRAGSRIDADLHLLWTPVQIDVDLENSSVHRRDLGAQGEQRRRPRWRELALALAGERLEELGFVVLQSTTQPGAVFRGRLSRVLANWSNPIAGAVVAARYGYRVPLVVAVDGFGEIYARTPDVGADPGEERLFPPRSLTDREELLVEERHRRRRAEARRMAGRDAGEGPLG